MRSFDTTVDGRWSQKLQRGSKLWYITTMKIDLRRQSRKRARKPIEPRVRFWFAALSVVIFLFGVYAATKNGQPLFDEVIGAALGTMLVYHLGLAIAFFADNFLDLLQPPDMYIGDRPKMQPNNPLYYYYRAVEVPTRPPRSSLA